MIFRRANKEDLPAIIKMIANDTLGKLREQYRDPLPKAYYSAFEIIDGDKNQQLMVIENSEGEVVASFQLSFLQYLTYVGGIRCLVENVHVREDQTGKGIGKQMFQWIIETAKKKGVHLIQLTSNKLRPRAIRFYEGIGFKATHEGFKLHL
ncbi:MULTISPECIES: GNAT family N-acetyltransferase [unclassified Arenibacter]|jgi:GNAT superfamily N-acetyltransferase|uniref:GNAT family N-acetyltransferase n=1 Tax=unclassified Arenibacter TaxID=2615047 RepID=UPI000E34E17F|nr:MULTISPECIES: GNAT family N-acetyltransferase [unclassified Arenibacter]MCM4163261.1 GNAT family N-acetyltransferase [Arenibacter sp. A80]RFT57277.1 GNAT family N-acetyltransferase [Arenibacter sp. P308M17]